MTRELLTLQVKVGLTQVRGPLGGHDQKRGVAPGRGGNAFFVHFDPAGNTHGPLVVNCGFRWWKTILFVVVRQIRDDMGVCMEAKIVKWGNSLALRIPNAIVKKCGLSENTLVDMIVRGGGIVIRPVGKYDLSELLAGITPENVHGEIGMDAPAGKELL